jgi:hypothetical protein
MKRKLDEQLCKDFPLLFRNRYGDKRQTAMVWGFECADGWFDILWDVCRELEAEIKKLPEDQREYTCASQIKEKYGTLRLYMHSETEEMSWLIDEAENKSAITCETCGKEGELKGSGWYYTACNDCDIKKYLSQVVSGILSSVKEKEEIYNEKVYKSYTLDDRQANIDGMLVDLKEFFNPTKEPFDLKGYLKNQFQSVCSDVDYFFWSIKNSLKHPKRIIPTFIDKYRQKIKYKIWKLKRRFKS